MRIRYFLRIIVLLLIVTAIFHSGVLPSYSVPKRDNIKVRKIKTDTLAPGIIYRKYKIGNRKEKLLIHLIEADLTDTNNILTVLKAENNVKELEKLHDMIHEYDSTHDYHVVGATNASYWKAYHHYPLGPTIVEGEVVELDRHRSWNSAFFTEDNKIYIDNFILKGVITNARGQKYELAHVNRRTDTTGIVLYNSFSPDTIPIITKKSLEHTFEEALEDSVYSDITENPFDTTEFKQYLLDMRRDSAQDYSYRKVRVEYLDKPMVNKIIHGRVLSIDTGLVAVPENGFVLSIGEDMDSLFTTNVGDTITLKYSTNKMQETVFTGSVSGTPKLMRNGRSKFEGKQRQGRARFKYKELPRSGIGTNKDHNKLYLISASSSSKKYGIKGCTLENFAYAMKRLRIYNAINLDGGGSTVMVTNGRNPMSCATCSRRISVGVGVARKDGK